MNGDTTRPVPLLGKERSPSWAAVLSFIWPGLGQLYRGRSGSAVVYALPPFLVLVMAAVAVAGGLEQLALRLFSPAVALSVTAVIGLLALWRIVSILDARRRTQADAPEARPHRSLALALILSVLVIATHGFAGYYTYSFYRAGQQIHEPLTGAEPSPSPMPSPSPDATVGPDATAAQAGPTNTPSPAASMADDGMINVLFVGIDRGLMDNTNTDTILLASFDPRTDRIVMISLPRDTAQVPLYSGGTWNGKINALYHYAVANPGEFPDGGMGTLVRQMEFLIGVPIHYYASIEMAGFWGMIDLVGGVDVVLERPIRDPVYHHTPGERGFFMDPGPHHLDGRTALAYVRSRHGPGNSDYVRARRQQQVLLGLRERLHDPAVLLNMPALLDAASEMVRTDVPLDRIPEFVELVQASAGAEAENYVLAPRRFAERIPRDEAGGQFATRLKMDAVAALSLELFGAESRYAREEVPPTIAPGETLTPVESEPPPG
jgi:polyisoprenyl-teichoic acid--peptidoglycan teichoic acid transferase